MGVDKKKLHQCTENYPKFPWIFGLTPKDHLRPLQMTKSTDEFRNFTVIFTKKLSLMRRLQNVIPGIYDLIASESVP